MGQVIYVDFKNRIVQKEPNDEQSSVKILESTPEGFSVECDGMVMFLPKFNTNQAALGAIMGLGFDD